jgi:hypothetical protein
MDEASCPSCFLRAATSLAKSSRAALLRSAIICLLVQAALRAGEPLLPSLVDNA